MANLITYLYGYTRTWSGSAWIVDTPVARLLSEIETKAADKGLTVSRWQSSKAKWIVKITYIIHDGSRPMHARHVKPFALVAKIVLHGREGKTERCEAYRQLCILLKSLEDYQS